MSGLPPTDEAAARLLGLGRESGITRYDLIAGARKQLARTHPGRRNPFPL